LFTTNVTNLFGLFLNSLPYDARQHYTCRTCTNFVERFGGLVTIDKKGNVKSAMWDKYNAPSFFKNAIGTLKTIVENSTVTGVFVSSDKVWGTPKTGEWKHMSVMPHSDILYKSPIKNADQRMAELKENYKTLSRALQDFSEHCVDVAIKVLETDKLFNSDNSLARAKWLKDIHTDIKRAKTTNKNNIIWKFVANAPTGFCNVRSSVIGSLLQDIIDGYDFTAVKRRFNDKMKPGQYMRPQVAPSAGNLEQANKIVQKLGAEGSLSRRFARLDELVLVWDGNAKTPKRSNDLGIFSNITPKEKSQRYRIERDLGFSVPNFSSNISWVEFEREVLPFASKIEFHIKQIAGYCAIVTASNMDAPPVIQWDTNELRNPFSWYVYMGGSHASDWNLPTYGKVEVTGITTKPSMWFGDYSNQTKGVIFILKGAKDKNYRHVGNALFPSIMKGEFHEIRAAIEAYSKSQTLEGYYNASACGIMMDAVNKTWSHQFTVHTNEGNTRSVIITRWE
jgi:hypothetical protein